MDWQQATALAIVGVTAALFIVSRLRRRKPGCGCGCAAGSGQSERGSIVLRARKGQRPQVIVRPG